MALWVELRLERKDHNPDEASALEANATTAVTAQSGILVPPHLVLRRFLPNTEYFHPGSGNFPNTAYSNIWNCPFPYSAHIDTHPGKSRQICNGRPRTVPN